MFYLVTLLNRFDFQLFYLSSVQNVRIKIIVILHRIREYWIMERKIENFSCTGWSRTETMQVSDTFSHIFSHPLSPFIPVFLFSQLQYQQNRNKILTFALNPESQGTARFICFPWKQRQEAAQHSILSLLDKRFQICYKM